MNHMKKIIGLTAAVIILLAASGCSLYGGKQTAWPSPAPSTNAGNTVSIKNFSFNPAALTVKKRQTVVWVNNDAVAHSIKASAFNSGILNTGQSFSFTFNQAGSFNYSCGIHPTMKGKIIVK